MSRTGESQIERAKRIVDHYRELIESGELEPGSLLPTEYEMCEQFGVTGKVTTMVRLILKYEGLVSSGYPLGSGGRRIFIPENKES